MTRRSILSIFGDIRRANQAIETYERLSAMSDRRLAQRGIARDDIVNAAYEAAFGKYRD